MKRVRLLLLLVITALLYDCSSTHILITSNKYHFPLDHSRIMIVAVIKDGTDSTRKSFEKNITGDLRNTGYTAVSALEEFGPGGLANLGQEATYRKLCSRGIDAVIIVTTIDKNKEKQFRTRKSFDYPGNYYYDRIWTYKNIRADLSIQNNSVRGNYFWEAILFNLSTLEAECTIQSPSFKSINGENAIPFEKLLIKTMLKEKILKKQNTSGLKPF